MAYIAEVIIGARIRSLTERRDEALRRKDYDRVWELNMKIDRNINRLVRNSYYR